MPFHRSIVNLLPGVSFILVLSLFFALVAVASYYFVRRFYPKLLTESTTPAFGVIGTAVVFLLGFTIALLWQNYQNALKLSLDEASTLYVMLMQIKGMTAEHQAKILTAVQNYLSILKTQEWPAMRLGVNTSAAWDAFNNIYDVIRSITPTASETSAYGKITGLLDSIASNRLTRLQTVDPLLSIDLLPVIFFGACFMVFSYAATSPENTHNHVVTMAIMCVLIAINIGLALLLTYPFSGSYGVQAKALLEGIPQKYSQQERQNNINRYQQIAQGVPDTAKPN